MAMPSFEHNGKRDIILEAYGVKVIKVPAAGYRDFYGVALNAAKQNLFVINI